jgi:hypothetical protein
VTLVAHGGRITFEGSNHNLTAHTDKIVAYVTSIGGGDDVNLTASNSTYRGTIFSLFHEVDFERDNITVIGCIIAGEHFEFEENNGRVIYDPNYTIYDIHSISGLLE